MKKHLWFFSILRRFCKILAKHDFFSNRIKSFWEHLQVFLLSSRLKWGVLCNMSWKQPASATLQSLTLATLHGMFLCGSCVPDILCHIIFSFKAKSQFSGKYTAKMLVIGQHHTLQKSIYVDPRWPNFQKHPKSLTCVVCSSVVIKRNSVLWYYLRLNIVTCLSNSQFHKC